MTNLPKEPIRLTNRTARALREQAKQQRTALYVFATVISIILCALAVLIGIEHLIAVPVFVLIAIALDSLIILLARGRYLSLTGQAICTEAAARQMRGENAEMQRVNTAARDLQRIKDDLNGKNAAAQEEDADMYSPLPKKKKPLPVHTEEGTQADDQGTREIQPISRRRQHARLTVLSGDDQHNSAD